MQLQCVFYNSNYQRFNYESNPSVKVFWQNTNNQITNKTEFLQSPVSNVIPNCFLPPFSHNFFHLTSNKAIYEKVDFPLYEGLGKRNALPGVIFFDSQKQRNPS